MEKEFIGYTDALDLKELGFDESYFGYYPNCDVLIQKKVTKEDFKTYTIAPLYQQAFRWFREKYGLFYDILQYINKDWKYTTYSNNIDDFSQSGFYKTYEEAEFECLKKLIEIVKNK